MNVIEKVIKVTKVMNGEMSINGSSTSIGEQL